MKGFKDHCFALLPSSILSALPSPAGCIQIIFLLSTSIVFLLAILPTAEERKLLLSYGPRRTTCAQQQAQQRGEITKPSSNGSTTKQHDQSLVGRSESSNQIRSTLSRALQQATALGQVPHSWFFTYYAFYALCATFWTAQYLQDGKDDNVLKIIAERQVETVPTSSTATGAQLVLVWGMMLLQAIRRLYECFVVMKPSKSTMWFLHWIMGLGFYFGISMAVWVEASAAILQKDAWRPGKDSSTETRIKAAVALPLFLYGWTMQHQCHKHLAGLRKYSLPEEGLFRYLVCPHYACECLIYSSLAISGAPEGQWCNKTLLSGVIFVAVNLGVTAFGTRQWYAERFGMDKVASKWIMIPFLY